MNWLHEHRFFVGILADSLTFLGGLLLARDAFRRLRDLKGRRTDEEFRRTFPGRGTGILKPLALDGRLQPKS